MTSASCRCEPSRVSEPPSDFDPLAHAGQAAAERRVAAAAVVVMVDACSAVVARSRWRCRQLRAPAWRTMFVTASRNARQSTASCAGGSLPRSRCRSPARTPAVSRACCARAALRLEPAGAVAAHRGAHLAPAPRARSARRRGSRRGPARDRARRASTASSDFRMTSDSVCPSRSCRSRAIRSRSATLARCSISSCASRSRAFARSDLR